MKSFRVKKDDKYVRLLAEFDNYKKRTAREQEQMRQNAKLNAVEAFLPLIDNLQRAAAADAGNAAIVRQAEEILGSMGVQKIATVGEKFDPTLHDAVMHVEDENAADNEIIEEFVAGYIMNDRVIRHSMVKVAN